MANNATSAGFSTNKLFFLYKRDGITFGSTVLLPALVGKGTAFGLCQNCQKENTGT